MLIVFACLAAIAVVVSACSFLLDTTTAQCTKNSDCAHFAANATCDTVNNVCRAPADGGPTVDAGDAGDGGTLLDGCIDPTGFDGAGCYACPIGPTSTNDQIINACPSYPLTFLGFDNTQRIVGFDPSNPLPPLPDGGADAADGGATDSGVDAGPCGPSTCSGCCADLGDAGTACVPGTAASACGTGGTACSVCAGGTPNCGGASQTCIATCQPITSFPNPVIFVGSTGFLLQPTIDAMGRADGGASAVTLVFYTVGSCDGVDTMTPSGIKIGPGAEVNIYVPLTTNPIDCAVAPNENGGNPYPADLGAGGLFWDTCNPNVIQPSDFQDFAGAVNPVGFIVPHQSTQTAISGEAAYRVFGLGSSSGVAPWTIDDDIWRRNPTSGNQTCVSRTLGVPIDEFAGHDSNGGANLVKIIAATLGADAENTIGLSSSEVVDQARSTVTNLAYQHYGQRAAFYWDSDPTTYDRRPIRDGHSFMWLLLHVFGHIDASGNVIGAPGNAMTLDLSPGRRPGLMGDLVAFLTLQKPLPDGSDVLATFKSPTGGSSSIPSCAMHVTRTTDSGPLSFYQPPQPCDCAWELAPPGISNADCHVCTTDNDCSSFGARSLCSFGYCEVPPGSP